MSNLIDALNDLQAMIEEGMDRQAALVQAAEDYGLNSILLRRKFEEQFGMTIESYVAPDLDLVKKGTMIRANEIATAWANKYTSRSPYFGKTFKMHGEEFMFVVVDAAQPKWGLKAVRVSDGNKMRFHVGVQREIAAQIKG